MSKKTNTPNTPAVVEPKASSKITLKTKFTKDSVEATLIREVKKRERKITAVGKSLVSLWLAQGQEILEFIAITEVSQRLASDLLGLKRTAVNTYCTIANDPRMLNPEFTEQLENFTQKELIKLTQIDDEEVFDKALEDGHLPKPEVIDVEVEDGHLPKPEVIDVEVEEGEDRTWAKEMINIIENSATIETAQASIANYVKAEPVEDDAVEAEVEAEVIAEPQTHAELVAEAIELSGETELAEQAVAIGLKKSVLKKAIDGAKLSTKTYDILSGYVNS